MHEPMVLQGKTQTGALDFNVAAAVCYLPVSFLHLVAAGIFLATEPKEHRFVRFHAIQSLLVAGLFMGGAIAALIVVMVLLPIVVMIIGGILAAIANLLSDDLAAVVSMIAGLISMVCYFGGALLSVALSLGFLPAMLITGALALSGGEAKWPVLGRIAMRFA